MNFSIDANQSSMSNSLMENEGNGPTAKKRKLSTSKSNPLTRIQAEVLQFENEKLRNEIEKLDKENQYLMDQCEKYKKEAIEVKDTVTTLQAATADLQEHSTINAAKIKTLEDEKQKFEAKIKELEVEHSSMKTVKSEIKDTVEDEREASRTAIDKLNAEIKDLKNKVGILQKENQKLLVDHEKDTVKWQQQKEASEKEISYLRDEKALNQQIMEIEKQKFEIVIKELEAENYSMKIIEIKGTVEGEREASRTRIDKLNVEIMDLKNKNGMLIKEKQKLLDDFENDTEDWQQQKEASQKEINNLRNKNDFNEKMAEKEKEKFEAGIKELENEILSMKINVSKTKKDIVEVQRKRVADAVDKLMKLKDETNAALKNCLQSPDALFTKSLSLHQKLLLRSIIQEIRATSLKELDFVAVYDCYRRNCLASVLEPLEMCSTNGLLSSLKSMGYIGIKVYGLVSRRIIFKMNVAEIEYLLKQY